ncbi:tRNA (N6-threonylcarbamoyladenosine(37)-N6)-methyltransferase TrmO [Pseudomonadota bacterium]
MSERPRGKKPPKNYTDPFLNSDDLASQQICFNPIGVVHSPFKERYAAPRQPALGDRVTASIELNSGENLEQAVKDLESFTHIWVIYWMHLNRGWNPTVIPPRGPKERRGVLATRAPHRPNSIGLSAVRLVGLKGRMLEIETLDMLDGTPVLDIKPYIPYADSIPDASHGWLDDAGLTVS